ncbi:unnamed protein product [Peniophora sp. CBMAI 1063]|nr:unnamed protein product [Peniophora sp. CBMAI 1063]
MSQFGFYPDPTRPSPANWPRYGDFFVFTVDPVASVAHLDRRAVRAARSLPRQQFVALAVSLECHVPFEGVPFSSFEICLVRQGLPRTPPPFDFQDMCCPIFPNTDHPSGRRALRPMVPFPLSDCYIDLTEPFLGITYCRVPDAAREYKDVVQVPVREVEGLMDFFSDDVGRADEIDERLREGDLEVVARVPLPSSPQGSVRGVAAASTPSISSGVRRCNRDAPGSADSAADKISLSSDGEDVSMIASDDSTSDEEEEEYYLEVPDPTLHERVRAQNGWEYHGNMRRHPVVHVSYDLSQLTEITDPLLFIDVRDKICEIIIEAEIRLGLLPDPKLGSARYSIASASRADLPVYKEATDSEDSEDSDSSSCSSLGQAAVVKPQPPASRWTLLRKTCRKVWRRVRAFVVCRKEIDV